MIKATPPEETFDVTPGVSLRMARLEHTATRLADGRVLLVGGNQTHQDFSPDAEVFDPTTGQTSLVAPLHTPRAGHVATLLSDGRVLVVGGGYRGQYLHDAEVCDPVADTWTVVPPLYSHAGASSATLMNDGRVLSR